MFPVIWIDSDRILVKRAPYETIRDVSVLQLRPLVPGGYSTVPEEKGNIAGQDTESRTSHWCDWIEKKWLPSSLKPVVKEAANYAVNEASAKVIPL